MAAAVARATHAITVTTSLLPAACMAAGVGGAFDRCVAVTPLDTLQVTHALVELQETDRSCDKHGN